MALSKVSGNTAKDLSNEIKSLTQTLMNPYADLIKGEQGYLELQLQNLEKVNEKRKQLNQAIIKENISQETLAQLSKEEKLANKADAKLKKQLLKASKIKDSQERADAIAKAKRENKEAKAKIKDEEKRYKDSLNWKEKLKYNTEKATIAKLKADQKRADAKEGGEALKNNLFGTGKSLKDRLGAIKDSFTGDDGKFDLGKGLSEGLAALSSIAKELESNIDEIAKQQGYIDTRLQGSKNAQKGGSYWNRMVEDVTKIAGASPFVKQEDVNKNIRSMVDKGISYNVEQRAFLETIKDKIASTFDAANGTLLRLVRIQQEDSTAARLGMESAITTYLNNMYETSEYLGSVMDGVKGQLEEAEALMATQDATAFEYQVQKWLGSLYSVGMSQNAVSSIATALGQLASGDLTALNGSGIGNLMLQAASKGNVSVSDILNKGLTDESTNKLLESMVLYLQEIASSSKDSKVMQQQYANIYGLTAADLKAAMNLAGDVSSISKSYLSYDQSIGQLNTMTQTIGERTSFGEMLGNAWDNFQYTMAAGIADSPALYGVYKTANLLDLFGGGAISAVSIAGTGIDLNTSVADIMRTGALAVSAFKGIGSVASSLSDAFSGMGLKNALSVLGVGEGTKVERGNGEKAQKLSGASTSSSGYIGNTGSDIYDSTMSGVNDSKNQQQIEAKEEAGETVDLEDINTNVLSIFKLLSDVISGTSSLTVKVEDYGLSWH